MLWFQVRAGDFSRAGSERRPTGLPIVNRTWRCWFLAILLLSLVLGISSLAPYASAHSKGSKGKPRAKAGPSSSPDEQSFTNIPMPIGHVAIGIVLPIFAADGLMRGKFEIGYTH